jgi:hypothetical protein
MGRVERAGRSDVVDDAMDLVRTSLGDARMISAVVGLCMAPAQ